MSPENRPHKSCFGYLGAGWQPEVWGDRRCAYAIAESWRGRFVFPPEPWQQDANRINVADSSMYAIPSSYPHRLRQAISNLPYYPNATARAFNRVADPMVWDWGIQSPANTVQVAPAYTLTAFTTADSPDRVREYYMAALEQGGWTFLYAGTSDQRATWHLSQNNCAVSDRSGPSGGAGKGCTFVFVGRYGWPDERHSPYNMFLTTTLTSTAETDVELVVQ